MNSEQFTEIMSRDNPSFMNFLGDNVLEGLLIIRKYCPAKTVLEAAEHDVIYSVDMDDLIKAGITEEDVIRLRNLNWMIDEHHLACFV